MPDFGDVAGTTLTEIFSENRAEINIGVGREDTNPVFFKLWQVIKQGVTPLQKIRALTGSLGCIMKTNAGLGSIEFGLFESTDGGVSFDSVFRVSTGSTSFQDLDAGTTNFFVQDDADFIMLGVIDLNSSVSGTIKEHKITITLDLPPSYRLQRVQ